MPNKEYINPEADQVWQDSGAEYAMTLANLADAAGRQGAEHDLGTAARAGWFAWRAWVEFATAPTVGNIVRVLYKTGSVGNATTRYDNDDGTTDIAVSNIDKLQNLTELDPIVVDEAVANIRMSSSGFVFLPHRYFIPVIWNASGVALRNTSNTSGFELTPVPNEIQ